MDFTEKSKERTDGSQGKQEQNLYSTLKMGIQISWGLIKR